MPADLVNRIREIVGMPSYAPDADLPRAVMAWGARREADGLVEGRMMELEVHCKRIAKEIDNG